ncbi:MAG TPA: two-component regulator propeller domain-containing protein [Bryobacteraceae bacterium]|nr:two-component regulator propeller domain-containing protein [Bryobacteraceae bacterium]
MIAFMAKAQRKVAARLALLLTCCTCVFALDPSLNISQYAHTAWKIRDGFVKGTIFSIAQTPDGYLWLGTEFGLVRFDGVRAIAWQPPPGDQVRSMNVRSLLAARDGTLWVGTWDGLASWKDGKFTEYPEVAGHAVGPFLQDENGTVWIAVQEPGSLWTVRGGTARLYETGIFGKGLFALYEDHKGNLWASSQTGLWRLTPGAPERYIFPGPTVEAKALIGDDNGVLVMATATRGGASITGSIEGLKQLVGGEIRSYALPGHARGFRPTCLFRSSDGSLWVGTVQGLLHLHQGSIDNFVAADGLSGEVVRSIFEDREGCVWVSTQNGLDRFREVAVPTISASQGLSNSAVNLVEATPDGSIWIGTADGLNRWEKGRVTVYGRQEGPDQISRVNEGGSNMNANIKDIANSGLRGIPRSLGQDNRGRLWAATGEGVFYFERGRFTRVPGLLGGDIYAIAGDTDGKVWISNVDEGLICSNSVGPVQQIPWTRFGHKSAAAALLPDRLPGRLWLGFHDGGIAYLKDGQPGAYYSVADGLGHGSVNQLQGGSDGAVWAATEGGLSRLKDGQITTLTSKNGLPCDAVHWVMQDSDHSFWLSMPCGLVRIPSHALDVWVSDSKSSVKTTVFDSTDGFRSRASAGSYGPKVTRSMDGKLWFSPLDGVSVIDPHHIPLNKLPPPVEIQQITADGKLCYRNLWHAAAPNLRLPPLVRDLEIDYTALSFVAPEKVRFKYKLEGYDRDWQDAGNRRQAFYDNLSPRNYRFRVMASNNSGVWNETGASLDFAINAAYYQTNLFRALCVAALLTFIWTIYRARVRILEQHRSEITALNERLMRAQEEERMRIAGELHDGVLQQITSLTLRLGTATLKLSPDSEPKAKIRELQKDLVQIGTEIRHLSHELHPVLLQESGLCAALSSYCQEFSKIRGIPVSCDADESVNELSPEAALCLYRIAQEALGNVGKHSRAAQVQVKLQRSDGNVCLSVSDDGVGFNSQQKSGGLGLINMRERVHQLNGIFEFDSEAGRGTRIKATVPFRVAS